MNQLAQFETPANATWFRAADKHWHNRIFGKQAARSRQRAESPGPEEVRG
jgi:hypothetical protein